MRMDARISYSAPANSAVQYAMLLIVLPNKYVPVITYGILHSDPPKKLTVLNMVLTRDGEVHQRSTQQFPAIAGLNTLAPWIIDKSNTKVRSMFES